MFPSLELKSIDPLERVRLGISGPSAFYMTGEDVLQLSGWNITTGVRLRVSGRFLGLDGVPRPFVHDVALTANRVIASVVRQLGEGWILNLTVDTGASSVPYGACFARVQVVRGLEASGIVLGTLCAGYVTSAQPIAFPGGRVRSMVEGRGNIRLITGTNPAAGAEISETVPTGARWRVLSARLTLTTDATVVNRMAMLRITDGATVIAETQAPQVQVASLTYTYNFLRLGADRVLVQIGQIPIRMHDFILPAGYTIQTTTANLQAADDWAAPVLHVEEWLDGQ